MSTLKSDDGRMTLDMVLMEIKHYAFSFTSILCA